MRTSGNLIIANQVFKIDAPLINYLEPPFWDATKEYCEPTMTEAAPKCVGGAPYGLVGVGPYTKRYSTRPALRSYYSNGKSPPLEAVKAVIKQFVIHHDGCTSADMCFNVLQNERGLSVHFLIDNDGTIYQTIDLALMAYHAADWNINSIGVELCNKGDAKTYPGVYDGNKHGPKRDLKACKINGHTFLAYDYTIQQYDALRALGRALTRLLPNLPAEFPQSSPGQQSWDTMPATQTFSFAGYIGHYHLTAQKWDPGWFDFADFCRKIRGAYCFPVKWKDDPKMTQPVVPDDSGDLQTAANALYAANEQKADGGFFPVGPWGESRLWHGGVHMVGKEDGPVFAPFPGRLVAARMGTNTSVGSVNFVLLRHDMSLGKSRVQFYSLYMHLADEGSAKQPVDWMKAWAKAPKSGDITLLDEPIEAGAMIGHVGKAGPGDMSKSQIHVEFFSNSELFGDVPGSPWKVIDGTASGRFCEAPEINQLIDTDHDGTLSKSEIQSFYSSGGGAGTRYMVTWNVSEWTSEPSWVASLLVPKDFKKLKPAEVEALVADQITPGLWWDAAAAHCKLPPDGVVYHYHPISFVSWFNEQMHVAAASAGPAANASQASAVPSGITDDYGDKAGTSMRSSANIEEDPCNQKLGLQEMVLGFDAPECTP